MPVPINLVSRNPLQSNPKNDTLDISFLATHMPKEASESDITLSDKDAKHVMNIWLHAKKIDTETFDVAEIGIDNADLIRLKSRGLISGGTDKIRFTPKGRTVVKTMALGENNKFLKDRKEKSYTEILASMNKRGKKGYRMAGIFDEYSHLLSL